MARARNIIEGETPKDFARRHRQDRKWELVDSSREWLRWTNLLDSRESVALEHAGDDWNITVMVQNGVWKLIDRCPKNLPPGAAEAKAWALAGAYYAKRRALRRRMAEGEQPKDFARRAAKLYQGRQFYISSSHGTFTVGRSGRVLSLDLDNPDDADAHALIKIVRFDVQEFKDKYSLTDLNGVHVDILDIGFWRSDGTYEPPDSDWRITP